MGADKYYDVERPNLMDRHHLGFINLWLYVFRPHKAAEAEHLSYLKPANIHNIDGLWPRSWLYSRVLLLFAIAFAVLYGIWTTEDRGESSTLLPGLTVVDALGVPMSMVVFFFECNKFRSVPLLRVFQSMLIGSVVTIAITFMLTLAFDWGIYFSASSRDWRLIYTQRFVDDHPEAVMAISLCHKPRKGKHDVKKNFLQCKRWCLQGNEGLPVGNPSLGMG